MSLDQLMKQAQQMQAALQKTQTEISNLVVEGVSGAGAVKIEFDGNHNAKKCHIEPSAMQEDPEVLADLVVAAINNASHEIRSRSQRRMMELSAGISLPEGFDLSNLGKDTK